MQKLKLNLSLLITLVVATAVVGVGAFLVHRYQSKRHVNVYLDQARELCGKAGDEADLKKRQNIIIEACKAYQRYLKARPEDVEVQYEEAVFLYDQGMDFIEQDAAFEQVAPLLGSSQALFEQALREAGDRKDIRKKFVNVLYRLGNYSSALQHIQFLGTYPTNEQELQALFDRYELWDRAVKEGLIEGLSGKDRDLAKFLDSAKKVEPSQLLTFLGDDFWMILEDSNLLNMVGRSHIGLNNIPPAIEALKKSVTLDSGNIDAYDALIKSLRLQQRSEWAEHWLTTMVESNPDSFRSYLVRGEDQLFRTRVVSPEEATDVLIHVEWDALKAVQKAVQQLLELAEQALPDKEITKNLQQDFEMVVNLAPAPDRAVTSEYRNALLKAVAHVSPVADLLEKHFSDKQSGGKKEDKGKIRSDASLDQAAPRMKIVEEDMEGCRDGLLLAVSCGMQKAVSDEKNAKQHIEASRDLAKAVLAMFPDDSKVYLTLADIELQAGNLEQMVDWLARGAQKTKNNTMILWRLGVVLANMNKTEEAHEVLEQLRRVNTRERDVVTTHIEAMLDMVEKNWSGAAEKLEKIRSEFILNPEELRKIDILLAECYGKLERWDDHREAYKRASSYDRSWRPALFGLAKSRVASGDLAEAVKDYQVILKLPDVTPERYGEYADLLLQVELKKPKSQRNYRQVEEAIEVAESVLPNDISLGMVKAEFLTARGDLEEARDLLLALHEQAGEVREKILQARKELLETAKSATGSERTAKLEQAKILLAHARAFDSQQPVIWAKIVGLDAQKGDWKAAEDAIRTAEEKLGDSPALRWLKAQKMVQKSGLAAAADLHPLAENLSAFDRVGRVKLLRGLASLAIRLGDASQAEKLANEVLKIEPVDVEMQKILFDVARQKEDLDAMKAMLAKIRNTEGKESAFWYYGEAICLYLGSQKTQNQKLIEEVKNLLAKAQRMEPDWPAPVILLSRILQGQGKLQEATELLLSAVRKGLQDPTVVQDLAGLLARQRRFQEADEMFNLLAQFRQDDSQGVNIPASYVKAQLGDFDQAASMARKACENSKDYKDYLWLGRVLSVAAKKASEESRASDFTKLHDEAEQAFRKSLELDSSMPETWIAFTQFYSLIDEKDKGVKLLDEAKEKVPADEVDLMLAQAYESLGKIKTAAAHYRKVVRNDLKDPYIAKAAASFFMKNEFPDDSKMLLTKIADKKIGTDEEQVAWAKRALGMMLVREKGTGDLSETLKLLDENLKNDPQSALDLYTKAVLLARDPTGQGMEEALSLLEQVREQQRDPGVAVLQELANLYYFMDERSKFKETMQKVLGKAGDQPRVLGAYVARLSEHKEYSEARIWLDKLKDIAPDEIETFFIESNLVLAQKQYDDLLQLVKDWVTKENPKVSPEKRLILASQFAQKCATQLKEKENFADAKRFEKLAEGLFLALVEREPRAKIDLAVLYAKQNQPDRAIAVLRENADKSNPIQVGLSVYNTLKEADFTEKQLVEIQNIVEKLSQAQSENAFLKMVTAVCEEHRARPDQAEAILRKIIAENPENVDAINYLAVTLALEKKNLEEAQQLIDKVIAVAGPKPDFLDSRAMVLTARNRPQEAINDLRQAISEQPSASFYFHLAEALQQKGLRKLSKDALARAQKLGLSEVSLSPPELRNYKRLKMSLQ